MKLADIIRLARRIVDETPCVVSRKGYVAARVEQIDQLSESVLDKFTPERIGDPLRLVAVSPVLEWVRRQNPHLEIRFQSVNGVDTGRSVYGFVAVEREVATVVYSSALNLCWTRFTLIKELMHLCLRPDWRDGGEVAKAGELLRSAQTSRVACPMTDEDLDDEASALFLALEVLVPWVLRSQYRMLRSLSANSFQQAKAFMIPANMMEMFASRVCEGVPYCELSDKISAKI